MLYFVQNSYFSWDMNLFRKLIGNRHYCFICSKFFYCFVFKIGTKKENI